VFRIHYWEILGIVTFHNHNSRLSLAVRGAFKVVPGGHAWEPLRTGMTLLGSLNRAPWPALMLMGTMVMMPVRAMVMMVVVMMPMGAMATMGTMAMMPVGAMVIMMGTVMIMMIIVVAVVGVRAKAVHVAPAPVMATTVASMAAHFSKPLLNLFLDWLHFASHSCCGLLHALFNVLESLNTSFVLRLSLLCQLLLERLHGLPHVQLNLLAKSLGLLSCDLALHLGILFQGRKLLLQRTFNFLDLFTETIHHLLGLLHCCLSVHHQGALNIYCLLQ
jgi:hypothetical protein